MDVRSAAEVTVTLRCILRQTVPAGRSSSCCWPRRPRWTSRTTKAGGLSRCHKRFQNSFGPQTQLLLFNACAMSYGNFRFVKFDILFSQIRWVCGSSGFHISCSCLQSWTSAAGGVLDVRGAAEVTLRCIVQHTGAAWRAPSCCWPQRLRWMSRTGTKAGGLSRCHKRFEDSFAPAITIIVAFQRVWHALMT